MIDLAFSWQHHMGDGRFSEPSGTFLGVKAHVAVDPHGGGTPVIQTIWKPTENAATVIGRITDQLRERDRWNGPKTVDWEQVFRDMHRAIVLSVAYKRRDTTASGSCTVACMSFTGRTGRSRKLGLSTARAVRWC